MWKRFRTRPVRELLYLLGRFRVDLCFSGIRKEGQQHRAGHLSEEGVHPIMQRGVVKWFNDAKGYGFIQQEVGPDIFVHHTAIQMDGFRTLKQGQQVQFELNEGPKGLHAAEVTGL